MFIQNFISRRHSKHKELFIKKIIHLFFISAIMITALGCSRDNAGSSTEIDGIIILSDNPNSAASDPNMAEANAWAAESFTDAAISMPPQSYVGRWGEADNYLHILIIYNEEGHREINFFWHISGRISTRATALIQNNMIVFAAHDDTGHVEDYIHYAVSGTMDFDEDGNILSVERSDNPMIRRGETFRYTGTVFVWINDGIYTIARRPVTQAEYEAVMGINPSELRAPSLPVGNVSWFDAVEYCNRRSQAEGLSPAYTISGTGWDRSVIWNRNANGYRLPTEAEWEYAWNLFDLYGNVLEWCWDWYAVYRGDTQIDSVGPASGSDRVLRGQSDHDNQLHSTNRYSLNPSGYGPGTGFRLVRPGG